MRMPRLWLIALAGLFGGALRAGDTPPPSQPQTFRPIPEMPEVLMFEDFDGAKPALFKPEMISVGNGMMNSRAIKLQVAEWAKKSGLLYSGTSLSQAKLKAPSGLRPDQVFVQFMVWSDAVGEVTVKFKTSDSEYEEKQRYQKEKTWQPIALKFSDLRNKTAQPDAKEIFSSFEIGFKPRDPKAPAAYVDDIVITVGVRPADILPRLQAAQRKQQEMTRTFERDGFAFTPDYPALLNSALRGTSKKGKSRSIVILGSKGGTLDFAKSLKTVAEKTKLPSYNFSNATLPGNQPLANVDDMLTFLPYAIEKNSAEVAVLVFSPADVHAFPNVNVQGTEVVRTLVNRALEMGCVPVICLPPPTAPGMVAEHATKIQRFQDALVPLMAPLGVPIIQPVTAFKTAPATAIEKNEYTNEAIDIWAAAAAPAIRHVDMHVFNRK